MLRRTDATFHRTARARQYVLKDSTLSFGQGRHGVRTVSRAGVGVAHATHSRKRIADLNATEPTKHAFPLLSHTDFGYHDHAANTKWVQLANYMPKMGKGTPPWWRGGDTYSPLYSEQGRFEYQRYMMIARFPMHYKQHFQMFLAHIRAADKGLVSGVNGRIFGKNDHMLPQEALHALLRMIVDNFNPQHCHYLAAMRCLMSAGEYDMARDVWRVMERQQTWPDDKLLACYLELCTLAKEKTWAIECWNRYCNEKRFLDEPGEADPKPVSRVPFTLNRDELLYLPKWKKFFDHDPNLDVADLNRFNTTRNIYRAMCIAMISTGEVAASSSSSSPSLFETFFGKLETALLSTPTPVPEPPHPHLLDASNRWGEDPNRDARRQKQWTPDLTTKSRCEIAEMNARFLSNEQFLVRTVTDCIAAFAELPTDGSGSFRTFRTSSQSENDPSIVASHERAKSDGGEPRSAADVISFCDRMLQRLKDKLGEGRFADVDKTSLYATIMAVHRYRGAITGEQSLALVKKLHGSGNVVIHPACHLEVLRAFADESAALLPTEDLPPYGGESILSEASSNRGKTASSSSSGGAPVVDAKRLLSKLTEVAAQLADSPNFEWTSEHHFAILRVLVNCGTMTANKYFVSNVLRKFAWSSDFCELLYLEYRRGSSSVDEWAELTKRMLVWTERYRVRLTERCKRLIERDYDTIRVQVRSFRDVAVFSFRHAAEKKQALDPAAQLPNPVMDYVSHALPFPDRDTGYPNEYGDIGQWRDPASGIKGPPLYTPAMHAEAQRGYTAEWRENTATANSVKLAPPFDKKYVEYNRGRHPSYDQIFAGPNPEIFPAKMNFRRPTRWDFSDVSAQSKYKWSGPW